MCWEAFLGLVTKNGSNLSQSQRALKPKKWIQHHVMNQNVLVLS